MAADEEMDGNLSSRVQTAKRWPPIYRGEPSHRNNQVRPQ